MNLVSKKEKVLDVADDFAFETDSGGIGLSDAKDKLKKGDEVLIFYKGGEPITQASEIMMIVLGDKVLLNRLE